MQRFALWAFVFAISCGTTGDPGGGASNLPVSGAGPFKSLSSSDDITQITPPFVLIDVAADLDDPVVIADGEKLSLWVTAKRGMQTRIERADSNKLIEGFAPLESALTADQAWEDGRVYGPAIVRGDGDQWILVYGANGSIGWAVSDNGHDWTKAPGPAFTADGLDEGTTLGAPGAERIGDRVRVYYAGRGRIWAAEAPYADVAAGDATTWTRIDGDPTTPARDAMVSPTGFAADLTRVTARATITAADRVRHDLYFTTLMLDEKSGAFKNTMGFASSYTGFHFRVGATSILPLHTDPVRGPTGTPYGAGALLLYVDRSGARDAIAAALSP